MAKHAEKATPAKRGRKPGVKFPPPTLTPSDTVVRPRQLPLAVGISYSTARRMESAGTFPKRRQLTGCQAVGWLRSELESWLTSRQAVVGRA